MKAGKVIKWKDIDPEIINTQEIKGVHKRVVIGENVGAQNFFLRVFTLSGGGHSPKHSHPWEHEVFILRGKGKVLLGEALIDISEGHAVFVPEKLEHQFINTSKDEEFEFICVIPKGGS